MKDWERWRSTQQYRAWKGMRERCSNPRHVDYERYGGRGIKVCERWARFANFLADMGERPPRMSLDRIDNDGPYSPENCRWATNSQQLRNTRFNPMYEFRGERKCVADWADHVGMSRVTLQTRIYRGMSFEAALTTPLRHPATRTPKASVTPLHKTTVTTKE